MSNAIDKIKAEMNREKATAYEKVIGSFLLQHLERHPEDAGKIGAEGKTIARSLRDMEAVARKKKVDNMAVLTPDEGFAIIMKYYGIEHGEKFNQLIANSSPVVVNTPAPPASPKPFSVSLDDLL